jgi:2-oxoglutarate/2-oxoacid ferredoxin oxidoreductase subunit beta
MTGGQVAPTTPRALKTTTTPYGNTEEPFDLCKLVAAAGATYVARTTTYKPRLAINAIKRVMQHKGFGFLEIITQCPTYFGRKAIGTGDPVKSLQWIEDNSLSAKAAKELTEDELESKFILGTFVDIQKPVFTGSAFPVQEDGLSC